MNVRKVNDVSIVDITGRITLGDGASRLRETLSGMAKEGYKKTLLNLAETTTIDSSGLGVLVSGFASITNQGGQLKLLNLTTRIRALLLLTKLFTVFEVFEDEAAAVRSFGEAGMPAGRG
jgi:anti-sigma B factor antagonist